MSLGSIAHLQYYFARTGLLDGKGAQIAKPRKPGERVNRATLGRAPALNTAQSSLQGVHLGDSGSPEGESFDSPVDGIMQEQDWEEQEPMMLPPTVSTYNHRMQHVPSPPDVETMRRELRQALEHARQALKETQGHGVGRAIERESLELEDGCVMSNDKLCTTPSPGPPKTPPTQAWFEIEGMHLIDIVTLAIRSAKIYYTAHDHPERLTAIKSERKIREELLTVLDVLKRMGSRNFSGGMKDEERNAINGWITEVEDLLKLEEEKEILEQRERESWPWLGGDWAGRERERECHFLNSFSTEIERLPTWDPPSEVESLPTQFLSAMQSGLVLVRLHNVLVKKSKRHFGDIKTFHTDTAKPYRCAENLRYWAKAADIRWRTKITIDVTGIVHGQTDQAWKDFDSAILTWCKAVREELTEEWTLAVMKKSTSQDSAWVPPQLRFEMEEPGLSP